MQTERLKDVRIIMKVVVRERRDVVQEHYGRGAGMVVVPA